MNASSRGEQLATYLLVACAVFLTGMLAHREFGGPPHPTEASPRVRRVAEWAEVMSQGQLLGAADGVVTLVEFSDFQCPYCGYFYHTLDSLLAEYPRQLRVLYRHFPIASLHPEARAAALASECAAQQGRFEAYYHALFQNQGNLSLGRWDELAAEVGLDIPSFSACRQNSDVHGRLAADSMMVVTLGLRGTPTVLVDGWELPGTPTGEIVRDAIEAALRMRDPDAASELSEAVLGAPR